ncbi:MAG: hypothetical protein R6V31_02570, partial [Halohasta sp.]
MYVDHTRRVGGRRRPLRRVAAGGAIFAFTPAFDTILVPLLGPPEAVIEPARIGLMIMLPWTWTIAYRRFHQGLLIR